MDIDQSFEFPAPFLRQDSGMKYHYLPIPNEVAEALISSGTRRVIATINGIDENRAIHSNSEGGYHLVMGLPVLRRVLAKPGDVVIVILKSDPDPTNPDLPEELTQALQMDSAASKRFYAMTPGMQRSIAMYVTGVKSPESRARRAMELAYKLSSYTLHGDREQSAPIE
ncbi:MAG: YdeI/OmpD-associated family protein [Bacteroidetes bacterium]|nr:YdeI/OmpD-associated family protein [Bacteroidota bacterium]